MALSEIQKQLISDLFSGNDAVVLKAIDILKTEGSTETLIPMFDLLCTTGSELVKGEIVNYLNQVKDPKAVDIFVEAIKNPKYEIFKPELIAACWENGLDFSQHLSLFVDELIKGDYMVGIEAITLIETLNPPFNPEELNQNIAKLEKAYFTEDSMKQSLIQSCGKLLNELRSMQ